MRRIIRASQQSNLTPCSKTPNYTIKFRKDRHQTEMNDFATYQAFDPNDYLESYYKVLGSEADGLLRFLSESFAPLPENLRVLEFGGGPTVISLIVAAGKASSIDFCDYVGSNRAVVQRWLAGDEHDFDWTPYFVRALQYEGIETPTDEQVQERAARVRSAVYSVQTCDIYQSPPVNVSGQYDVIISNYCLDAVTDSKVQWHQNIRNLCTLLRPGGTLILSSLREATYSDFGETRFPNVFLQEGDVYEALAVVGFPADGIRVVSADADHAAREYTGVIFASAIQP